ncbi:hypothetical protein SAMN02745172_03233 [Pseudoxanthobacter soli DSM 19599]|uniref:Galactose mutarotase n=1 Tax=Pseudoxanthobacter soli DSM 19599 TaxID=1123029 RepID=A0A1M7ZNU9_9HYPH|nr:hypothetical protein [Pseudoxanthobacter soli]SHO66574.1 hypothetical protein SAMN02745172_03233 [Pseudoxanthobacter soli DSM 19599]
MNWHRLEWEFGALAVGDVGAMIRWVSFRLPSGKRFEPFARAPWIGSDGLDGLAPHLRDLGAEFACLPFGVGGPLDAIAPEWAGLPIEDSNAVPHGPAANAVWTLEEKTERALRFALPYPADHPVRGIERTIAIDPERPAIHLSLRIEARRPARVSVGLHPILTLAAPVDSLELSADFAFGLTYPAAVPGEAMIAAIGQNFDRLDAVPAAGGGSVDLSRLPKARPIEDVVQLCGARGPVAVIFAHEAARLVLDWDRTLLPSCQIWISDRALQSAPWGGTYRGLGIEPIASAFDFAETLSGMSNPISEKGIATTLAIEPGRDVEIRYSIAAEEIG